MPDPDAPHADVCLAIPSDAAEAVIQAPTVSDLLSQSRAHHLNKKRRAGRANKDGVVTEQPNYPQAEAHLALALETRLQAHALDPEHTDPAWAEDLAANRGISHEVLVASFREYPTIP